MRILIAIDSFKGSATAVQAAGWVSEGIKRVWPEAEIKEIPIADGGEGVIEAVYHAVGGGITEVEIKGPMGEPIWASYLRLEDGTAVIETAKACGLTLVKEEERNPLTASTYGVGQLILDALDHGADKMLIGIGGSATNDGGAGLAKALGVRFFDKDNKELGEGGAELLRLDRIDLSGLEPRLKDCNIILASDVTNALCGKDGASAVYGPQKGATEDMIQLLDQSLFHYASMIEKALGLTISKISGSGAAGGMGAGLMAFCNAKGCSGIETMLDVVQFDKYVKRADLVITGEGNIDAQTARGKVPVGVARRAKMVGNIPVIAVVGGIGDGAELVYEMGIDAIVPIVDRPMSLETSINNTERLLMAAGERAARILMVGRSLCVERN